MGDFQHTGTLDIAFALAKQTNFTTKIAGASLTKKQPFREFSMGNMQRTKQSDRAYFGKGHPFGSAIRQQGRHFTWARTYDATALSLAFGLSLCLQKVVTWTPSGATTARRHLITFYNPVPGNEGITTSLIEKAGDMQVEYSGVAVGQVQLNGASKFDLSQAMQFMARKSETDTTPMPAVSASQFLQMKTVSLGAVGGALTDISTKVKSFQVTFNQNPQFRWAPGSAAGDEQLASVYLIGQQAVSLQLVAAFANAFRAYMLNDTFLRCVILCEGAEIETNFNYALTLDFPKIQLSAEAMSDANATIDYQMTADEDSCLYDDSVLASGTATSGTSSSLTKTGETFVTKGVAIGDQITMDTGTAGAMETRTVIEGITETSVNFAPDSTTPVDNATVFSIARLAAVKAILTDTESSLPSQ